MSDLKNKFMDLLFDDDPDAEIDEASTNERDVKKTTDHKEKSTIRAKDILYRKPNGSAFINLNEEPVSKQEDNRNEYERLAQISPIFGVIKQEDDNEVAPAINETQTNKPSNSYLDIITSPIYGYGNGVDDSSDETMSNLKNDLNVGDLNANDEEEQLHHLFDNDEHNANNDELNNSKNDDEISLFKLFGEDK